MIPDRDVVHPQPDVLLGILMAVLGAVGIVLMAVWAETAVA